MAALLQAEHVCAGLAHCRGCGHPVPAPVGLFDRELFHLPTCPGCGIHYPHPEEKRELRHTLWTAAISCAVLVSSLLALQLAPLERLTG